MKVENKNGRGTARGTLWATRPAYNKSKGRVVMDVQAGQSCLGGVAGPPLVSADGGPAASSNAVLHYDDLEQADRLEQAWASGLSWFSFKAGYSKCRHNG